MSRSSRSERRKKMKTSTLIEVVAARLAVCDGNPTLRLVLRELLSALRRLQTYETA